MNRYTITSEFLEASALDKDYDYFSNVLMVFAQKNQYMLCLDDKKLANKLYEEIIRKHECLRVWLEALNRKPHSIEEVSIGGISYKDDKDLFLSIANEVQPYKQLITSNKTLFNDKREKISFYNIDLIDGNEAISRLSPNITQTFQNCNNNINNMMNIQQANGDFSSINNGNNNRTNQNCNNFTVSFVTKARYTFIGFLLGVATSFLGSYLYDNYRNVKPSSDIKIERPVNNQLIPNDSIGAK